MAAQEDIDAMQARINVALARSQKLVSSWLPPAPVESSTVSVEEQQRQEDEMFKPAPPRLGVGAVPLEKRSSNLEDDLLLKKLKISKRAREGKEAVQRKDLGRTEQQGPTPISSSKAEDDNNKHTNLKNTNGDGNKNENDEDDEEEEEEEESRSKIGRKTEQDAKSKGQKKRASTYLDELLAERGKKKKKKKA